MYPRNTQAPEQTLAHPLQRIRWWYGLLLVVAGIFIIRLFYLQVIRHDYYQKAAFRSQLKQYEIPATRGIISAHSGNTTVPLVLNETLYTLYADPTYIKDAHAAATAVQGVIGGDANNYEKQMKTPDTRYVILAKRLSDDQHKKLDALDLKGVGTRDYQYRTYPDGVLASQLLGFVNDEGIGSYGIEQALNSGLGGTPGELKAITDAHGVPLPANKDNTITNPVAGESVLLTVDLGLQQQTEDILKAAVEQTKSRSGSVVILDARTGAVKAMANYPTYDPAHYSDVNDGALFNNASVSEAVEVGSIMKSLTSAAALDSGAVTTSTTYYDPSHYVVDGFTIRNVEEDGGPGVKDVAAILKQSLNTGATWLLMQMGGGEINQKARNTWHDYLVNHYQLGKVTGIEQGYESAGFIPDPDNGYGLNLTYANTAFGQGMSATTLQMGAAFASILNGGVYYQPYLVDSVTAGDGIVTKTQPKIVSSTVIKPAISTTMQGLLAYTLEANKFTYGAQNLPFATYGIGGKTGTAQISKPEGGYYDDRFNGTYLGFVGGNTPQYVVSVSMIEPTNISGYAGAKAAAPVFVRLVQTLINSYDVTPKQ